MVTTYSKRTFRKIKYASRWFRWTIKAIDWLQDLSYLLTISQCSDNMMQYYNNNSYEKWQGTFHIRNVRQDNVR